MQKLNLEALGNHIRNARKACDLTQQELADQTGLSAKTIQDIEKGHKNPTYETLTRLMNRLGLSPGIAFSSEAPVPAEEMKEFLESFQACDPRNQEILLRTLHFLAEQLRPTQDRGE